MNDDHCYKFKTGLGGGPNNYAELFALKLLLMLAAEKGVLHIHIYGDSMVNQMGRRRR